MSILSATITQAELLAVYEAERQPDDPPLDVLARHTARYTLLLNRAISRREPWHRDLPIPAPWPEHVAATYPARAQCSPNVVPMRRRSDHNGDHSSCHPVDFKSLAAGAGC